MNERDDSARSDETAPPAGSTRAPRGFKLTPIQRKPRSEAESKSRSASVKAKLEERRRRRRSSSSSKSKAAIARSEWDLNRIARAEEDAVAARDPAAVRTRRSKGITLLSLMIPPTFFAILVCAGYAIFSLLEKPQIPEGPALPTPPDPVKVLMGQLSDTGTAAFRKRDYARALTSFTEMTVTDPGSSQAWNNVALTLVGMKRYEEALEPLSKAISLAPAQASIPLINRSYCLRILKRFDDAMDDLKAAQELNPGDPVASNLLLLARIESGDRETVATEISTSQQFPIPSLEPLSVGALIGLAVTAGDLPKARLATERASTLLSRYALTMILRDPLIAPHRKDLQVVEKVPAADVAPATGAVPAAEAVPAVEAVPAAVEKKPPVDAGGSKLAPIQLN